MNMIYIYIYVDIFLYIFCEYTYMCAYIFILSKFIQCIFS